MAPTLANQSLAPQAAERGLGRPVLAVLAVLALALAIFTKDGAGSWADASRLATIESIVERGTLSIDDSTYFWQGDKVRFDGQYYSHQPPMLALLGAGPYALLNGVFNLSIDSAATYRILTLVLVGVPVLAGAYALARLLRGAGLSAAWTAVLTGLAAGGTILFPYALVLNQHGPAAGLVLLALLAIQRLRPWTAGLLLSLACTIDLTAVFFALACAIPVFLHPGGGRAGAFGIARYALGALPPLALHLAINIRVAGDVRPFGLHTEAFRYPLSTFLLQSLTGAVESHRAGEVAGYIRTGLFGESGLFLYHPWLLACLVCFVAALPVWGRPSPFARGLLCAVLLGSLAVAAYYFTQSKNLGGSAFGMRWFAVFAPTLALFAGAWIRQRERAGSPWRPPTALASVLALLAVVSVAGAAFGAINPWAKFSWNHATSPLGLTGASEAPLTLKEHWRRELKRIRVREPITQEVFEAKYGTLLDQYRRFYLQPTPWLAPEQSRVFVRRGLDKLLEVAAVLDEESSSSYIRPLAHFWIGKFHAQLQDVPAARRSFQTVLVLRSNFPAARTALDNLPADGE